MKYRYYKGIRLSYNQQGLIYFTCQGYKKAPRQIRHKIDRLCAMIGGEDYGEALKQLVTTERSVTSIAMEYYTSANTLYRLKRRFYEAW